MFRIKFESRPDEVAAVKSAVRAAGNTTAEVSVRASKAVASSTLRGLDKLRASIHNATAPRQ